MRRTNKTQIKIYVKEAKKHIKIAKTLIEKINNLNRGNINKKAKINV